MKKSTFQRCARAGPLLSAMALILVIAGTTNASERTHARLAPRQSRCVKDSSVEQTLRDRLGDILDPDRGDDPILDTLGMVGSTFTLVTDESVCARAVTAYADYLHNTDSLDRARSLKAFAAVMVVRLKPNRYWIATDEFASWGTYRRVLVDSSWALVSRYP